MSLSDFPISTSRRLQKRQRVTRDFFRYRAMRDQKIRETETKRREEKERADARLNEREGPTSLPSSFSLAPHTQKCLACGSQQPRRRRRRRGFDFFKGEGNPPLRPNGI